MTDETSWTLVEDAAEGRDDARDAFARIYMPVVRAYLGARWRGQPLRDEVEDAAQEVFVDLMRPNGALVRAERREGDGGFRAFLFGVARNVALRHEERAGRRGRREQALAAQARAVAADDDTPSRVFDRAWAQAVMRSARRLHAQRAASAGAEALRRVELLRLRFEEGLPIRTIATRWGVPAARVHHAYAQARAEFSTALRDTVALHHGGTPASVRRECARLLGLLA